ncbi:MAG: efflux transporter outer membrane subunit [Pirellulales bacterium]|nr:efflux transporter outer membrane subunit [Pirellulales bacterium]
MNVRFSAVLMLLLVLTGCATGPLEWFRNGFKVGPNYARPPAPVANDWIDAADAHLKSEPADHGYWWTVFDDPVLNGLVQEAHAQNLPLKIAGARILEARAQLGVATGNLFPQEQRANGGFARSEFSENSYPFGDFLLPRMTYDTWSVGFDAAWELDFWGRFRRMVESAEANLNAQIENYDDVLVILQGEVAATYIQLRTLEERLRLARKNVELQGNTLRITEDRFTKGMVSQLDVQQALANMAATESMIPVLETNHRKARNRLCTLMGMPPRDLEARLGGATGKIPATPPEVAVGIPAELVRRRPDVRRAERQLAAQSARIGVAESELYPHIAITGNIGFEAENFSQLFDWTSIAGRVGPGFRWNILNYGRIRNAIRVEDARFQQAVLGYQETVLRAGEEAEGAITAYLREQVRVRTLIASTNAVTRAVELANIQYQQGLIDFQRVLDSERALVLQQDQLAESRGNVAVNLVAVYKALGGGWQMRLVPMPPGSPVPAAMPDEPAPVPPRPAPGALPPPPTPAPAPEPAARRPAEASRISVVPAGGAF